MSTFQQEITLTTRGFCDIHNVTDQVRHVLDKSSIREGMALVFVPGATASVSTIEYEGGAVEDLKQAIENLAPQDGTYKHNEAYGDGNGFSHVRAALLGPSITVPVHVGRLVLGTWQEIIVIDFDNRPRDRRVVIQITGD